MQELLVDFIVSLDGYAAAEGWPGWWGLEGPEYLGWLDQQPESDYTLLMGANTYRLMSAMSAESSTSQADYSTDEKASLTGLAAMPKVVFSSTLQSPLSWPNTRLVSSHSVEAVAAMKRDGTSPMRTLGSLSLCRSLLEAGLVDRLRLVVFPVITGKTGRDRIFRRLSRCRSRHGGQPDVRRQAPTARVRPHRAHRSAERAARQLIVRGKFCAAYTAQRDLLPRSSIPTLSI